MKTVFVGLSGGVDSAVSAYLLKKQGYKVVGAFIKGWEPDFLPCTGVRDRLEAMRVAAHLGIPFVTYDLEEEYKRGVVDYFVEEYRVGRTPNPDVMCNRVIKFGAFWERAKADGADFIATGHYAVNSKVEGGSLKREANPELQPPTFQLQASRDIEKDQTYFLWTLTQKDLEHSLFPVGGFTKPDVRTLAMEAELPNATRPDSQGLCFLGHVDMRAFLKRYIPEKQGDVLNESGKKIGEHDGAWFYTIGQRHGFETKGGQRSYVVGKDVKKNILVVSDKPLGDTAKIHFQLREVNWISGEQPSGTVLARYRYRQELVPVEVEGHSVVFKDSQSIAPGQSLVVYDDGGLTCLGGAVVHK